jgi:succinate dehydrogenase flavin-adding protein (antitoxin of CptAB toxin-antitoxin module)
MKELDVIMSCYLEHYFEAASSVDQRYFKSMLEMADPDLYDLLLGRRQASDPGMARVAEIMRNMSGNKN